MNTRAVSPAAASVFLRLIPIHCNQTPACIASSKHGSRRFHRRRNMAPRIDLRCMRKRAECRSMPTGRQRLGHPFIVDRCHCRDHGSLPKDARSLDAFNDLRDPHMLILDHRLRRSTHLAHTCVAILSQSPAHLLGDARARLAYQPGPAEQPVGGAAGRDASGQVATRRRPHKISSASAEM